MKAFDQNARVVFIGDSITHNGLALNLIGSAYRRHRPELNVKLFNLGIGGDSAKGALGRLCDVFSYRPTEAVVMFGVNDMATYLYTTPDPDEETLAKRKSYAAAHIAAMTELIGILTEKGLPVTLASAVGKDELTPPREQGDGLYTYGTTPVLFGFFEELKRRFPHLKNHVNWHTPMQSLLKEAVERKSAALVFENDRVHPSPLGQKVMAHAFLSSQGFPLLPLTLSMLETELAKPNTLFPPFTEEEEERYAIETTMRDMAWIYPHQKALTEGLDLEGRIAYWKKKADELPDTPENAWTRKMYYHYVEHAREEPELRRRYLGE